MNYRQVIWLYNDEQGNKVENNVFSTTRTDWDVLRFYAQGGDLKSNVLEIKRPGFT